MRKVGFALIIAALLSALYWAGFLAIAFSVLAGDRRQGGVPGAATWLLLFGVGAAGYGALLWLWRWRRADWRCLTPGELTAARSVFGDAIAWPRVRIYARGFTPFQPRRTAVTPLGAVHFRRADFLLDFSLRWADMAWLVHELVHVWQYQTGVPVILRGLWERTYVYGALDPARPFERYGIEQQAAIVEDWFRITQGHAPWRGQGTATEYRATIPFLPG